MTTQVNRTKAFHVDIWQGQNTLPSERYAEIISGYGKNMISNKRQESSNEWQEKEQIVKRPKHKKIMRLYWKSRRQALLNII